MISHASIVTPMLLGGLLAVFLYTRYSSSDVPFFVFALFMGVSVSITAFPVLARILTDRDMQRTKVGMIALTCAAVDDVTAWCLLALVVTIARHGSIAGVATTVGLAGAFVAFMLLVVQRGIQWLVQRQEANATKDGQRATLAVVFVGLLLSALATEVIGIHALFGAFLFGSLVPHDSKLGRDITKQVNNLVVVLLLPVFFCLTGLKTQIGLIDGFSSWCVCFAIIAVATAGKFGGSFIAARVTGLGWRDSAAIGALMNTRGLMELIVLEIGLELKVISPTIFTMMVVMALVTTAVTSPAVQLLYRRKQPKRSLIEPAPGEEPEAERHSVPSPMVNPLIPTSQARLRQPRELG
jgi:Kef-type K+ transport system membrane component KefB